MASLRNLTLLQIELIASITKSKGIRDLARAFEMDPAQVSRRLKEVEDLLGLSLFTRSKKGITVTSRGEEISQICKSIIEQSKSIELSPKNSVWSKKPIYTVGSRAFLNVPVASQITKIDQDQFRWRFVDSSPQDLLRASLIGSVDIAIHLESWTWPLIWQTEAVAELSWGLVAKKNHPLKLSSSMNDVKKYPFIVASYLNQDRIERATDVFKMKWNERILGHEAQTTTVMKSILMETQHICYLPLISVAQELKNQELKLIHIHELAPLHMPIYLSVHQEKVSQQGLIKIKKAMLGFKKLNDSLVHLKDDVLKDSVLATDLKLSL
jgi:LysR family transcriptional regulator of abg operon